MASFSVIKTFYLLSLVSFKLVCCNLYSDARPSDNESCDANDQTCISRNNLHVTEDIDGPTIVGRDGLTRLDGVKVSCFDSLHSNFSMKCCSDHNRYVMAGLDPALLNLDLDRPSFNVLFFILEIEMVNLLTVFHAFL